MRPESPRRSLVRWRPILGDLLPTFLGLNSR
jgi:hypothetical protein